MSLALTGVLVTALAAQPAATKPEAGSLRESAVSAMKRAATYMRTQVATHGGYLWEYSLDLKTRAGEGEATETQIWVQPPGTPSVGETFLKAYLATNDPYYLDAAIEAAHALAWGQLATGGWDYVIDFDPHKSKAWHYRRDVEAGDKDRGKRRCVTTFDDDTTQSALRFLMRLDVALGGKDKVIRETVAYGLRHFLMAQYPNGAWPQRYWEKHRADSFPVLKARYPETWSRIYPKVGYAGYYTLNDNTIADCISTMLLAHELYKTPEYLASARKGGDFLLLAQMPEPQPVWAQQYNEKMEPAWARKFEPPAVTAGESISAMTALRKVFEATGETRYIETLPAAFAWYKRSRLPDGQWARFYELRTNKPLYFTRDTYELTYDDSNTPTHYCFKAKSDPTELEAWYQKITQGPKDGWHQAAKKQAARHSKTASKADTASVRKIIHSLDDQGRWVSKQMIRCDVFIRNMTALSAYVEQTR